MTELQVSQAAREARKAFENALWASDIPMRAKLLLCAFLHHADYGTLNLPVKYTPGSRALAKACGMKRDTVLAYLGLLEDHGWVSASKARGRKPVLTLTVGRPFQGPGDGEGKRTGPSRGTTSTGPSRGTTQEELVPAGGPLLVPLEEVTGPPRGTTTGPSTGTTSFPYANQAFTGFSLREDDGEKKTYTGRELKLDGKAPWDETAPAAATAPDQESAPAAATAPAADMNRYRRFEEMLNEAVTAPQHPAQDEPAAASTPEPVPALDNAQAPDLLMPPPGNPNCKHCARLGYECRQCRECREMDEALSGTGQAAAGDDDLGFGELMTL